MKEKLKTSDYKTKIQVLTLTPESWSRRQADEFFEESEYSIRVARKLKEEKGILSVPNIFYQYSEEKEISFQQWQGTDRAMLCTQTTSIIEFLELLVDAISKLTVHSFIAKCQARYLKIEKTTCWKHHVLPCWTLLRITSLWSRMKSKVFIGTTSVVSCIQLLYTA